jgi:hypothetical protein
LQRYEVQPDCGGGEGDRTLYQEYHGFLFYRIYLNICSFIRTPVKRHLLKFQSPICRKLIERNFRSISYSSMFHLFSSEKEPTILKHQ